MTERETMDLMQRRIRQILIHSCIYYHFNNNIIPDYVYDNWGNELIELIKENPTYLEALDWGQYFKNYTEMSSGYNLPYKDPRIVTKAQFLLDTRKRT